MLPTGRQLPEYGVSKMNEKGTTLIEMLIVILIIGVIGAIAHSVLFLNNKLVTDELGNSLERNEVRAIANFLKEDIRESYDIVVKDLGEPVGFRSTVKHLDKSIIYTRAQGEDGTYHVVRRFEGKDINFPEITNAEIYDLADTEDLAQVKLYIMEETGTESIYEFKIARWRWHIMAEEEQAIYELLEEEDLFVIGAGFAMGGGTVTGDGATIYVDSSLTSSDLNGNAKVRVSNLYITGDIDINGNRSLGSITEPGEIVVDGNVTLAGAADIYGDVYVNGDLNMSGSGKIYGNVYVQGDFNFSNGLVEGDVYVNGNLYIKDGTLEGNMYVNGNVTVNWTPSFTTGSMVYYFGIITHPASYTLTHFEQMVTTVAVAQKSVPEYEVPVPRDAQWYADNGYVLNGPLSNGAKVYVTSGNYTQSIGGTISNVIVVNLAGDITISRGGLNLSGVIYAPYGYVTIGGASFTGLVIASEGADMSSGGMEVTFEGIETYIPDANLYPFLNEMLPAD